MWPLWAIVPTMVALVLTLLLLVVGLLWWTPGVFAVAAALVGGGLMVARVGITTGAGIAGACVAAAGPVLLVLVAWGRSRVRSRSRAVADARARGVRTTATVTDVPAGPNPTSRGLIGLVTFTFTDGHGEQRWVRRTVFIRTAGDVKVGDTTTLWYAAEDPGDESRISVEMEMAPGSLRDV